MAGPAGRHAPCGGAGTAKGWRYCLHPANPTKIRPAMTTPSRSLPLAAALEAAVGRYRTRNPRSETQWRKATAVLPGGNTRSVLFFEPFPLTMVRGQGCRLWDADGHEYVDALAEFSAGLYGHSDP